jgi:GxxExxY protein
MVSKRVVTPYDDITYRVLGCAMGTHREQGPGKRENTYQRSMEVRMTDAGVAYVAQKLLEVRDQGVLVGYYIPDFVVEDVVIVEIKALSWLDNSHLRQIIGYMAVTGCPVGLLINFGRRSLEYRRIFPPKDITEHRVSRQWLYVPDWLK